MYIYTYCNKNRKSTKHNIEIMNNIKRKHTHTRIVDYNKILHT